MDVAFFKWWLRLRVTADFIWTYFVFKEGEKNAKCQTITGCSNNKKKKVSQQKTSRMMVIISYIAHHKLQTQCALNWKLSHLKKNN